MRKRLAVAVALAVTIAVGMAPVSAEPASSSSGSSYGLSASGLLPIAPTITAAAAQPPDSDVVQPPALLTIPLGGLALSGTVGADAHAHRVDNLPVVLGGVTPTANAGDPTTLTPVNSQALAKTEGLSVLFSDPGGVDPIRILLAELSTAVGGLVGADAVSAEAVAKCVNNQPVFETGYQVAGLGGLVGDLIDPLVQQLLDTILALLGPGSVLSAIVSVEAGRVTPLADGVAIDGLVISVPLLNQEIIVSHAEAHMTSNCGIAPPPTVQPTGPGGIAPRGQLTTGALAATGSDVPFVPLAAVMIGAAFLLRLVTRPRPQSAPTE